MYAQTRSVVLVLTIAVAGGILGCNRNTPVGPSSGCSITFFPSTLKLSSAGGNGVVLVSTSPPQCSWTATASASWIMVDTGPSIGTGPLQYTVAPNPTAETRTGVVMVGTEVPHYHRRLTRTPTAPREIAGTTNVRFSGSG